MLRRRWIITVAAVMSFWGCSKDKAAQVEQMYADYKKGFAQVEGITARELRDLRDEVVLVDVRTPKEQAVSMIPGAITRDEFDADRARYAGSRVVAYCTIGARSGEFAAELHEQGWKVRNLEGSILAWTHVGGDLVGPDGPTNRVHVYGRRWNLAADEYEPVW
jgi:rhodanese-related sulfurtransferase